jgi:hypothetical protein
MKIVLDYIIFKRENQCETYGLSSIAQQKLSPEKQNPLN